MKNLQITRIIYLFTLVVLLNLALVANTQAATFTVTKIADTNDGTCDADCSLREAIDEANTAATDDVIEFASPLFDTAQTITLGGTQLTISGSNGSLTINGTGAKLLTIDGNAQSRVFRVVGGADRTINDLTITNGRVDGETFGGAGIFSESNLTLNNVVVDNNHSVNAFNGGGGIYARTGVFNVNNSTISNNSISAGTGGGIRRGAATITIINSTISGNSAELGGGIDRGGSVGSVTFINSTIVNNSALNQGGGIYQNFLRPYTIKNTIVANNTAPNSPDIQGVITSQGYNLIEDTSGGTINGNTTGNITGQDPMLGLLTDNGGSTPTHALQFGSPAIDAGDPAMFEPTDQRGVSRPLDGDGNGTATSDIGAVERETTFLVTKTADTDDGTCDADCSLREAIVSANNAATDDVIEFASPLFDTAQTITLSGTQLTINGNGSLTINGTGAKFLTIDGNAQSRVFQVNSTAMAEINDLTIRNGRINNGASVGGGINNFGHLAINRLAITNNFSTNGGAGIQNQNSTGSLNVNSCLVNDNRTQGGGGGISNAFSSTMNVVNSTISDNSGLGAGSNGGGISNIASAQAIIINSTIVNNFVVNDGGGIQRSGGTLSIKNTIVADNTANGSGPDILGNIVSQGYNLIENTSGGTIGGDITGNITGQDPLLFPLDDYGGPTPTHAPSINSPVIDKGSAADVPAFNAKASDSNSKNSFANLLAPLATDQRGMMRPQDMLFKPNAPGGDGSDIGAFEALAPTAADVSVSGRVITNDKNGRGIGNVSIQVSNSSGIIQTIRTNQFGNFTIKNLTAGETYIFTMHARRYQFAPQVITVSDGLDKLIFMPN